MMGILYAWATKEYLLEKMSFGQIVMYLNYGAKLKWPQPAKGKPKELRDKTAKELKAEREKLRIQYGYNVKGL